MKTLLLIDANSLIHRSFHALPPLTTPDGRPSQALYGVASILLKLFREEKPEYAAALFDRPEPTFRKQAYAAYKAQRPPAPDSLISQIIGAHELFSRFGIVTFEEPGFEADDLIATLVEKFSRKPFSRVVILTGDLDTLQLVEDDAVVVQTFRRGVSDTVLYDQNAVLERYGLEPAQLPDYKALVGDPSDNIKGIPGIGPKTATDLIKRFGSIEELIGATEADEKLREKLGPHRDAARQSRQLVILRRDVPLGVSVAEDLRIKKDSQILRAYFETFGFGTLVKRLEEGVAGKTGGARGGSSPGREPQGKMF